MANSYCAFLGERRKVDWPLILTMVKCMSRSKCHRHPVASLESAGLYQTLKLTNNFWAVYVVPALAAEEDSGSNWTQVCSGIDNI